MKSKEEKGEIMGFLNEFIIIDSFFYYEYVCELNKISMKRMRELLIPYGHKFLSIMHQRKMMFNLTYLA